VFPLFADVLHIPIWLPSLASFIFLYVIYPKAFGNKVFYWFCLYAFVLALYVLIGKPLTVGIGNVADTKKIFIEFAHILPTIAIFCILYYLKDDALIRRLIIWSIALLFVSFVTTVPVMVRYGSIRAALGEERASEITIVGLPSYSLLHAYTLFVPVMCYGAKFLSGRKRLIAFLGLLVLFFVVYNSFVTTSLIITVALLLGTLLYSKNESVIMWVSIVFLFITLYALYKVGFFISVIDWIMPLFKGTAVAYKLQDFKDSMILGQLTGGSILVRQEYHLISWQSFFQNPIFGTSVVGKHSSLIDRFGGMGIVAGVPFLMIFVTFIRQMLPLFKTRAARVFFVAGLAAGFIFLYQKGNWGCESWLMYMVLMPFGILTFEYEIMEKIQSLHE
jgi:hypothetical protein